MQKIRNWFYERTGMNCLCNEIASTSIAGGASWWKAFPAAIFFAFFLDLWTGFWIWMYYSPSSQTAWESIYYFQYHVAFGWLVRAMHHYSAQVLLILLLIYSLYLILTARYRKPYELIYWTALVMTILVLALLLTGDLLAWTQNGFASTQVRTKFSLLLPWIGEPIYRLLIGGSEFGHLTLTRFLAYHIGILSVGFIVFWGANVFFVRRANQIELPLAIRKDPCWPNQMIRNLAACAVVLVVVLAACMMHGVNNPHMGVVLGSPADPDPSNYYAAARPEWAFVGLYEFSHYFPGQMAVLAIFVIPTILLAYYFLLPFLVRFRWIHSLVTLSLLAGIIFLSFRSLSKDARDVEHQRAIASERREADRAIELASLKGIPPTGALTLLREDPQTQGPRLFAQHCASCHHYIQGETSFLVDTFSAPHLTGFGTRDWVAGFLDPKRIVSKDYYGYPGSPFIKGEMVGWVKENIPEMEKEEVAAMVAALSAEAHLPQQAEIDRRDAKLIEEGKELIADLCTDCHRYHDKGKLGDTVDLTNYASQEWLKAFLANPKHPRFYGENNDRMPAYAEFPEDPSKNLMSSLQLEMLSGWLRGDAE